MFGKALTRWGRKEGSRELSPFAELQREVNRLFESFFPDGGEGFLEPFRGFGAAARAFTPRVNVSETDREVRVTAELPGIDEKDIDVSVTRNTLTIRGEKGSEKEDKSESYYRVERSFGQFERTLPLPADVVAEEVEARFSKGILTVVLPKTEEARSQATKVKVKAE
jgi:HSP20 family protein